MAFAFLLDEGGQASLGQDTALLETDASLLVVWKFGGTEEKEEAGEGRGGEGERKARRVKAGGESEVGRVGHAWVAGSLSWQGRREGGTEEESGERSKRNG